MRDSEPVVIVLPLGATDDLAIAFGGETVVAQHRSGVRGVLLHVERLDLFGIVQTKTGLSESFDNRVSSSAPRSLPQVMGLPIAFSWAMASV